MSGSTGQPSVEAVYEALDTVKDPCMGAAGLDLSIVDLGLIYGVEVDDGAVNIELTFTEIGCIFTHVIGSGVYDAVGALPGVEHVELTPSWLPIWTEERLNSKASEALSGNRNAMLQKLKRRSLSLTTSDGECSNTKKA
jgi:metal-sulfur cluster biosynthetic enzyme